MAGRLHRVGSWLSKLRGFDVVALLDGRDWEEEQSLSIKLYACLAVAILTEFYFGALNDGILSPEGARTSLLAFVADLLCLVLVARYGALKTAAHCHILIALTCVGALTLLDRETCALLIWFVPLGPLLASFLLDMRSILLYTVLGAIPVVLGYFNGNYEVSVLRARSSDYDWIVVRVILTWMVSSVGAMLGYASGRGIRDLNAQSLQIKQEVHDSASNQRAKSAFLAQMSHEIRTPVHGIMGMILHLKSISPSAVVQSSIQSMQSCADDLEKLLTSILDLAKLESGKIDLTYTRVDLGGFVRSIAEHYEPIARAQGLTLVANTPKSEAWAWIDAGRTRQAICPLIENAIKFSKRGQVEVDLELLSAESKACDQRAFRVLVRDQGVGLSDAQQSSIFEHFEQFHDEFVREKGGIGLGLTLVSRLVSSLGGEVEVYSQAGHGSEFVLSLVGGIDGPPREQVEAQAELRRGLPMSTWVGGKPALSGALEQKDQAEYRRRRLMLFHRVFVPALLYYLIDSVQKGNLGMSCVLGGTLSYLIGSLCWMPTRGDYLVRSKQFIWAFFFFVVAIAVYDGQFVSDTLWLISLGPIIAAFLIGLRTAIRFMGLSFLLILASLVLEWVWKVPRVVLDSELDFLIYRLVYLGLFAAVAFGSSWVHAKQERALNERHVEWLALREKTLAANAAKSKFLATMSHEIRTPMNGVLGLAQDLLAQELTASQKDALDTIHRCGGHLLVLLNEILDSSRVESDEVVVSRIPFDATALVEDVVRLFERRAKLQGLELLMKVPPLGSCKVVGDPTRVMQVLANLVGNAIKFSDAGVVELELRCKPSAQDVVELAFICRDQGLGMTPEQLASAFEDYVQIDALGENHRGGTGLGLPISRRIARSMRGELTATSELGRGSVFTLVLTLERATQQALEKPVPLSFEGAAGVLGAKVLVVDDNSINRKVAALVLDRMGCKVTLAHHGEEALQTVQEQPFDLVLMDLRMPVMDGIEATRKIRALGTAWLDLPIVALTADGFGETRKACLDAGMNDHLAKPFRAQDLQDMVGRYAGPKSQKNAA